jgi:hypothetical protein
LLWPASSFDTIIDADDIVHPINVLTQAADVTRPRSTAKRPEKLPALTIMLAGNEAATDDRVRAAVAAPIIHRQPDKG